MRCSILILFYKRLWANIPFISHDLPIVFPSYHHVSWLFVPPQSPPMPTIPRPPRGTNDEIPQSQGIGLPRHFQAIRFIHSSQPWPPRTSARDCETSLMISPWDPKVLIGVYIYSSIYWFICLFIFLLMYVYIILYCIYIYRYNIYIYVCAYQMIYSHLFLPHEPPMFFSYLLHPRTILGNKFTCRPAAARAARSSLQLQPIQLQDAFFILLLAWNWGLRNG